MNENASDNARCQETQSNESLGILINALIHDFNNSIGIIHGYADLALRASTLDERTQNHLNEIKKGANALIHLTESLGNYVEQNKPQLKSIDIGPIIEQTIEEFQNMHAASTTFDIDIDQGCIVKAHPDQIRQIITCLCQNACDFSENQKGDIKIVLKNNSSDKEGYVKLMVSDSGKGMDAETLKRMFDLFFTTKPEGKASGLGLSVVKEIVKSLNGKAEVESTVGKGAIFKIYLPIVNNKS